MAFLLASSSTSHTSSSSSHLLLLRLPGPASSRRMMAFVCGSVRDPNEGRKSWGRKVDKHMHVLRSRIYKKRIEEEASYKDGDGHDHLRESAEDWMEWERSDYETRYVADVSRLVGLLQTFLLNTRPSIAVTLTVLAVAGLPALAVVGVVHLVEFLKIILSGICAT